MAAFCSIYNVNITLIFLLIFRYRESFAVDHYSLRPSESISDGRTLVSKEGSFELGFFSPGSSKNRYLGIWYKKITVQTVVWVANRCNPINDMSGTLTLNRAGNLVLTQQNKSVVLSTSLSSKQPQKPIAELLDSGNLVVREEDIENTNLETLSSMYLWESFDYPTDTLLPGMKHGWDLRIGLNRKLTAWKNTEDPCSSNLTVEIEQLEGRIRQGNSEYFRTGPWNGFGFTAPDLVPNQLFDFWYNFSPNYQLYYTYNLKNNLVISRVVLNHTTGKFQRYSWHLESDQSWRLYSSIPRDYCDNYGRCGPNGVCFISQNPICQCFKGFKPKSQEKWDLRDWSEGCVRKNPLKCEDIKDRYEDGFLKIFGLKMPDTTHSWHNDSMNLKECRAKCLRNCSCMAYSNTDIRGEGSGCRIWFGDLIDIRQIAGGVQDLYIRIPSSEIDKADSEVKAVIVASVVGVVSALFSVGYYIGWRTFKEKTKQKSRRTSLTNGGQEEDLELPLFYLSTIISATDNFSENNKLGEGGFGPVYRGKLVDEQEIAVKRLSMSSGQGVNEFKNEVKLIAKLQHRNLVKLLGCCIQGEEKLLVYEYMPNKSLDSFIFGQVQGKLLEWPSRFHIINGIARGLLYLHQDSRLRIIHRDLKTSNILLDNEMNPKISDFGMARIFGGDQIEGSTKRVVGTYGYMAPEYAFRGIFSIKSDIFSFGIMVLEIVSGKRSRSFRPQNDGLTLTGLAWKLMKEGREIELVDACLMDSCNLFEVLRCIRVGLLCVQQQAADRPSMSSVLVMLSSESELPHPKRPAYSMDTDLPQLEYSELSSTNNVTMTAMNGR